MKIVKNRNKYEHVIYKICIILTIISTISSTHAVRDEDLNWSTGDVYKVTPIDSSISVKNYTIKAIEFPAPVRGTKTVNDTRAPNRPVVPFIGFELYKDIIDNPNPIEKFSLGIDDTYIIEDQELRITIDDIPGSMSADWVYEVYDPWANIRIQKRAIPDLDVEFELEDTNDTDIYSGDQFKMNIILKNVGDDAAKDFIYDIDPGPLLSKNTIYSNNSLKDRIYRLDKNARREIEIILVAPANIEETVYTIRVSATGYDIKNIFYNWNATRDITVRRILDSVSINKTLSKDTIYLKENLHVISSITNEGPIDIRDIKIHDFIPNNLYLVKDDVRQNISEFSENRNSLGPYETWSIEYNLKPVEPGIYVLPTFITNFSIEGRSFSVTSNEAGFRVYGPIVVLNKSVINQGNNILEVRVTAKNIGNGPTRVVIDDQIPDNTDLMLGDTSLTMYLNPDIEKVMNYTIRTHVTDISKLIWPQAKAMYFLDDYKFETVSKNVTEEIFRPTGVGQVAVSVGTTALPNPPPLEGGQKKVVATISAKKPIQTSSKDTPGFRFYESFSSILLLIVIVFLRKKKLKMDK